MTVAADLAAAHGTRRRLAVKIDGIEPILWEPVGVGVDDVGVFDPPGRAPLQADCVACWRMEETNATDDAADATGHGHTATQTGSPPVVAGKVGAKARQFLSGDYFSVTDDASKQLQRFTVEGWVYYDGSTVAYPAIYHHDHASKAEAWTLGLGDGTKLLRFIIQWTDASSTAVNAPSDLSTGWHHIAATWDGTTQRLYLDGTQIAFSAAGSGKTVSYDPATITIGNDAGNAAIQFWQGFIDELALYNTAKPREWFTQAYASGSPETRSGINCLIPPDELSVGLNEAQGRCDWSGLTLELLDVPDPTDTTTSYFGKQFAPGRWDVDGTDHWRLAWASAPLEQIDANDTTITFDDVTDLPSSGTLHLAGEVLSYTGLAVKTISGVIKGLYPALGSAATWGSTYSIPEQGDGPPQLAAGEVPFSLHGRRVGVYLTTFDRAAGHWNPLSAASLVWAGRITTGIKYCRRASRGIPGVWQVSCEALTATLDRKICTALPKTALGTVINLQGDHGRSFQLEEYTWAGAMLDFVVITVPAGVYTPHSLYLELQQQIAGAAWGAGTMWVAIEWVSPGATSVSGPYGWHPTGIVANGPFRLILRTHQVNPGYVRIRPVVNGYPCHVLNALGFGDLWDEVTTHATMATEFGDHEVTIDGTEASAVYHPLSRKVNGGYMYCHSADIPKLLADQGDYGAAAACVVVREAMLDSRTDSKGNYLARYTSKDAVRLTLTTDPMAISSVYGFISEAWGASPGSSELPTAQQVYVPSYRSSTTNVKRGPFEVLLKVLCSTGTSGYNGTYDVLPLMFSVGMQDDVVDTASFLAADQAIMQDPTAQRWDPAYGCYYIDEPISFAELLERECKLYGYALCWRRGSLTLTNVGTAAVDGVVVTLDDNNAAHIHDAPDTDMPTSTVVNRYECEVLFNHYTGKAGRPIAIVDDDSVQGMGGLTQAVTIKHPGIPNPGGVGTPDVALLQTMLGQLLRARDLRYPSQIVKRSLDNTLEEKVFTGDVVRLQSDCIPDPLGSGSMTVNCLARVLNKSTNRKTAASQVTLKLLTRYLDWGKPWAPAALVDIDAANGGWDAVSRKLTLIAQEFTAAGFTKHDGERFEYDMLVNVIERNSTTPTMFADCTVIAYTAGATKTLELNDDAATAALAAGWDSGIQWVVVFADYGSVSADQKECAFQASPTTHKLGTTRADRWG